MADRAIADRGPPLVRLVTLCGFRASNSFQKHSQVFALSTQRLLRKSALFYNAD